MDFYINKFPLFFSAYNERGLALASDVYDSLSRTACWPYGFHSNLRNKRKMAHVLRTEKVGEYKEDNFYEK